MTNRLALSRLALAAVYLTLSAWTALAIAVRYEVLLYSIVASLLLFAGANVLKRGDLLLGSWLWMGANFVIGESTLVSGTGYLWIVLSVMIVFAAGEVSNFLEFLYPMRTGTSKIDVQDYERRWALLRRHVRSVILLSGSSTILGLIGIALASPLALVSNPLLAVGVSLSLVLALAAAVSLEWRSNKPERSPPI